MKIQIVADLIYVKLRVRFSASVTPCRRGPFILFFPHLSFLSLPPPPSSFSVHTLRRLAAVQNGKVIFPFAFAPSVLFFSLTMEVLKIPHITQYSFGEFLFSAG